MDAASAPPTQPRVVIVDDHPGVRRALRDLLEVEDIVVVADAGNGKEAVEVASALAPDVVLMDLEMPGMDGLEATQMIVSTTPSVRVVVLTARDDPQLERQAEQAGASAYLVKSVSGDVIRDTIRRLTAFED